MIKYLLLAFCLIKLSHLAHTSSNSYSNSSGRSSSSSLANQSISINDVTQILLSEASQTEKDQLADYFNRYFNLNALKLIYPKSVAKMRKLKRGVLATYLRYPYIYSGLTKYQQVAIKLERMNNVRAKYDYRTNTINCNKDGSSGGVPVESYIASLMQNQPYFVKYHSTSHTFYFRNNLTINMYVYDKIDNARNLQEWTMNFKRTRAGSNEAFEASLAKYFLQMHRALTTLYNWGFVYTDFKPENVLIDESNDKSYLIDLESVASSRTRTICLRTIAFTPPLYEHNRLVAIDSLSNSHQFYQSMGNQPTLIHDRVLAWTFCYSIYSLACTKSPADVFNGPFRRSKFNQWSAKFTDTFKCPAGSVKLNQLLNACLLREQRAPLFNDLLKQPWLASSHS